MNLRGFTVFVLIFHQGYSKLPYSLINDKAVLEFYNETAGKDVFFNFKQINTVQFSVTGGFTSLYDFEDGNTVDVHIYSIKDEKQTHVFNLHTKLCNMWKKNMFGIRTTVAKYGNMTACGIKKDVNYYIKDYIPELSAFPPVLPQGYYLIDISIWSESWKLFVLKFWSRVGPPMD